MTGNERTTDTPHKKDEDDLEWEAGIRQRECSCRVNGAQALMKRPEYNKHLKDGTHNERMKGSAPKEVKP
jgi:hypothetical protein